jgi:hypothetical protein
MHMPADKTSPSPASVKRWNRKKLAAGVLLVAGAVGALIFYLMRPAPLPPLNSPTDKIIAFIGSEQFVTLPESQQIPYVQSISKLTLPQLLMAAASKHLTDEQKRQAFINGRNAWLALHLDECFSLPPGPQRDAYFDRISGSMEVRLAAANGGWARNPGKQKMTPRMIKQWIESVPPTRRALAAEFAAELEKRGAFHE